jgi:hypothetical protein
MRSSVKAAAAAAAALPLFITACSSASNSTGSTASTSIASTSTASTPSSPASSASAPARSTGDPLASLNADQIASKANTDLKTASSYRMSGTITGGGTSETEDLTSGSGNCAGTFTFGSSTAITLVLIGKTLWVQGNKNGAYLKTTASNSEYRQMITSCSPAEQANALAVLTGLTKDGTTVIRGQAVLRLREAAAGTIYVTDSATPEYVRIDIPGLERTDYSGINAPVSISPPPASKVING